MEPFYFGESDSHLFGIYHPPDSARARDLGIVLCHPLGQEYMRAHRAFLQLALRFSDAGFHVLRFDLSGCGDSAGDFEKWSIAQWTGDVCTALEELESGTGATRICVAGLRLGADLAALVASERGDVDGAVLWDPVISGREYLHDIAAQHKSWLRGSFAKEAPAQANAPSEVLGFGLSDSLVAEIERMDLLRMTRSPARRVLVMESGSTGAQRLVDHLGQLGPGTDYRSVGGHAAWLKHASGGGADPAANDALGSSMVPSEVLEAVVSWTSKVFA